MLASVSDWHKLGLNLGVQDYELDQIHRSRPAEGCDGWKRETFSLWLRHTPSASWRDVVGALQQMGEKIVAEMIEQKYIKKDPPSKLCTLICCSRKDKFHLGISSPFQHCVLCFVCLYNNFA